MTDGTPGWFRDPSDGALARWHDGEKWTDHTLVIADQTPGEEPPPPDLTATAFAPADPDFQVPRRNTLAGLPTWAKVGAPIAVVLIVILAVLAAGGGGGGKDKTNTADTRATSLDAAVTTARDKGLDPGVSDGRAAALITRICSAASNPSEVPQLASDLAQLPANSVEDVRTNVEALGAGAKEYCRSKMDDNPDLISNLADQAAIAFTTTTTAPTIAGATDGGTDAGATTSGSTSGTSSKSKTTTTVKGKAKSTTTTAKPTTTTKPLPIQRAGFPCSSPGAKAQTKNGTPLTCQRNCGPNSYSWSASESICSTTTTLPPAPNPTAPSGTTGGGTTGGGDPVTTGGQTTG